MGVSAGVGLGYHPSAQSAQRQREEQTEHEGVGSGAHHEADHLVPADSRITEESPQDGAGEDRERGGHGGEHGGTEEFARRGSDAPRGGRGSGGAAVETVAEVEEGEADEAVAERPEDNGVVHALREKPGLLPTGRLGKEPLRKFAERDVGQAGDQRAAEEEHIVRMGLLASGAAHELGTPLATMSVVLGDWKHMPQFANNPDMLEELEEIEGQLLRCKSIVSGILLSAGETRGESSSKTSLNDFFEDLVQEWESSRPVQHFEYHNHIDQELTVAFDSTVKQMVFNVLDNALEVSPNGLRFEVSKDDDTLFMTVTDQGPGFQADILAQLGTPYNSSKGRPGGGLGLFLVMNVARTLGGTLEARNCEGGGAQVRMTLPLSSLVLQENGPE